MSTSQLRASRGGGAAAVAEMLAAGADVAASPRLAVGPGVAADDVVAGGGIAGVLTATHTCCSHTRAPAQSLSFRQLATTAGARHTPASHTRSPLQSVSFVQSAEAGVAIARSAATMIEPRAFKVETLHERPA